MTAVILKARPAAPGIAVRGSAETNILRLFALDRPPPGRRPLVCRWRRDVDGRLTCTWEPDTGLVLYR